MVLNRRKFIVGAGATGALVGTGSIGLYYKVRNPHSWPISVEEYGALGGSLPVSGLARSAAEEYDYLPPIEGSVPKEMNGTLYRNGPGLYERGGLRKNSILDGDGYVQAFHFKDGSARYRTRFVQTKKFKDESSQDRYLYRTWSTLAPGWWNNTGRLAVSQAGVTVVYKNGKLFAFDDTGLPYEMDPNTLSTLQETDLAQGNGLFSYNAHSKTDGKSGDWILFNQQYGKPMRYHILIMDRWGAVKKRLTVPFDRRISYIHDFFVTERHVVFNISALDINVFPMLAGARSFMDCMKWQPQSGNTLIVVDKNGTRTQYIDVPAVWCWHTLNAYERGDEIIADFVGFDQPDHLVGERPALKEIMKGQKGTASAQGKLRRYYIDLKNGRARGELIQDGNFEFPKINPQFECHSHRYGYFTEINTAGFFHTMVSRFDYNTGAKHTYDFGEGRFCGEAVYVPNNDARPTPKDEEPGFLMTQVYDSHVGRSFLAILRAERIEEGPLAKLLLHHHVPLSFHGYWAGA